MIDSYKAPGFLLLFAVGSSFPQNNNIETHSEAGHLTDTGDFICYNFYN